jgi:hypothetical protein
MFSALLSQGFAVSVETGVSLQDVLCRQLGIDSDYLHDRIKTVFLNGQAVDDVNRALVGNGTVVALSAAMPGLVGAMMRRGGLYAGFRNGISYQVPDAPSALEPGTIQLKLFNLVAKELGPHFFALGIQTDGHVWRSFLTGQPEDFKQGIISARVDHIPVAPKEVFARQWPDGPVHLTVNTDR